MQSLIKLAAVFALIVVLIAFKRPINLVMAIASVVVVLLYRLPMDAVLPALKNGVLGYNTINALLVLYCITFLQRMMESRKQLLGCQTAMNGLFNNRRVNAALTPFMLGCLPAASTVLICGPIVRDAVGDSLKTDETAAITSYFRHISEAFMPTYSNLLIAVGLTAGLVTPASFVVGMLPVVLCLFLSGYFVYLRKVPRETGMVPDQPKSAYLALLVKSIWPIFLSIALVLMPIKIPVVGSVPVWGAVTVCIILELFVNKFSAQEVIPFFRTAFEAKLMLNTLAVMIFGQLLNATGVVTLLPEYFAKLPIPMFLIYALIFTVAPLVGGTMAVYVLCIPMMLDSTGGVHFFSLFLLCMTMQYVIMQVCPTHICLTLCAEDYKIPLGSLIAKAMPLVIVATILAFGYYFILSACGL